MSTLSVPIKQLADAETSFSVPIDRPKSSLPVSNPTKSFWIDSPDANPLAKEGSTGPLPDDADVCIIGSGITGVSAAYHLSKSFVSRRVDANAKDAGKPLKVMILEARDFCSGATGRNGGHLTPLKIENFHRLETVYGVQEALKSVALEIHTRDELLKFISSENLGDSIDLVAGGHVSMFVTEEEHGNAKTDFESAKAAGVDLSDLDWLDEKDIEKAYGATFPGARFQSHNLWPLKLVTHLYNHAKSRSSDISLTLHTSTPVTSVAPSSGSSRRWSLSTPRGSINCSYVLHATNGYASHLLPHMHGPAGIVPTRGQVIALRAGVPIEELGETKCSWDANEGFEYWFPRPIVSGSEERNPLVILGGGREVLGPDFEYYETNDGLCNELAGKALREFLPKLFVGKYVVGREPEMEWTGIMGFTKINDPFIGPVIDKNDSDVESSETKFKGQYVAAGYSGHGMPRAFACAEVVASMILADVRGNKWTSPPWLPERYLTWNRNVTGTAVTI